MFGKNTRKFQDQIAEIELLRETVKAYEILAAKAKFDYDQKLLAIASDSRPSSPIKTLMPLEKSKSKK